jgi:drug/metabolite transporter (DMT)-like permease
MSHRRAIFLLVLFGMLWAVTMPLTKIAVSTGHQPLGLIFWQLFIASVVLGVVNLLRKIRIPVSSVALRHYLIIALLGTIFPNSFSYLAAAQLPAGIMSIIIATVPMFSMLVALGFGFERFSPVRSAGVLLGAIAVVILVGPDASLPEPEKAIFVLVALIAPFCYGLEGNYVAAKSPAQFDPICTTFGASIIGLLVCAPLAWFSGSWVNMVQPWRGPEWALFGSSVIHAITYTGYIWFVGVTSAVFASQIAYVVTLGGVFFSALLLSESYSTWVFLALGLMMGGLLLVQPGNRARSAREI